MKDTDIKVKIIIIVLASIIVITIGLYVYKMYKEDSYNMDLDSFNEAEEEEEHSENDNYKDNKEIDTITVHITGEIKYPGVVVLKEGDRIVDAIEAGGGETENADLNRLNLAYKLSDGDKIYVPNKNERLETDNITIVDNSLTVEGQTAVNSSLNNKEQTVNINTATLKELTELPGIGKATANKIIEYRTQNGKFKTIEDIKNVPGIGDSKFNNLKGKIRVK